MFKRPQHSRIAAALGAMNAQLLQEAKCYFGGGTAISLRLDEYRRSDDIDFLCADSAGYRKLRESVFDHDLRELFPAGIDKLRDVRIDQYGIRTFLQVEDMKIKFEIVREGRIELFGETVPGLAVPCLARDDLYAEKILANADRFLDTSVLNRDILDLLIMERRWGPIPAAAWTKAEAAYGTSARNAYARAKQGLREDRVRLESCLKSLDFDEVGAEDVRRSLTDPAPTKSPSRERPN